MYSHPPVPSMNYPNRLFPFGPPVSMPGAPPGQQQPLQHPELPITVHTTQPLQTRRGPWLPEEDRKLMELISVFGPSNWVRISNSLCLRTPKQCRERYHQNLKPSLNRTPITIEEGLLIEKLVAKHGKKWAEIARHLNGRSDNAIKNWWNGGANRRRRASTVQVKLLDSADAYSHLASSTSPAEDEDNLSLLPPLQEVPPAAPPQSLPRPSQFPQVPHLPQISFNTLIFGPGGQEARKSPPLDGKSVPASPDRSAGGLRLASFDTVNLTAGTNGNVNLNYGPVVLPPISAPAKRRLLDEPARRHSTANTLYSVSGNAFYTLLHPNLAAAVQSYHDPPSVLALRNNLILQYEFLGYLNSTNSSLRRLLIAPDFFPNPLKDQTPSHKRNMSQNSFHSPSMAPQSRYSVSSASGGAPSINTSPQNSQQPPKPQHLHLTSLIYLNYNGLLTLVNSQMNPPTKPAAYDSDNSLRATVTEDSKMDVDDPPRRPSKLAVSSLID